MKILRSILPLFFALLVLLSGTSFVVGIHVCGDTVQSVALFHKSQGCAMERELPPCHRVATSPCCEDTTILHQGQDFKNSDVLISLNNTSHVLMATPAVQVAEVIPAAFVAKKKRSDYSPPLPDKDRTLQYSIFLI